MTTISHLSENLVEEILSRVPLTSLRVVRSTCKRWNTLSKNLILGKNASRNDHQFLEFMVVNSKVSSLRFDLQGIRKDEVIDSSMKQINIPNNDQIEIFHSQVYHCDGLLLCITKDDNSKILVFVWNPYLGQTKLIPPRNQFDGFDRFAMGYDINRNHKILRFSYDYYGNEGYGPRHQIDAYDLSSDSWRLLDCDPNLDVPFYETGVSLKGNTYFLGREFTIVTVEEEEDLEVTEIEYYLVCFDFTTESFGPRMPLPFNPPYPCFDAKILSWVRDEKLAVLFIHYDDYETPDIIEIWISTKIEPGDVPWSSFLRIDMAGIIGLPDEFFRYFGTTSFFVDEENKVAVLFATDKFESETNGCLMSYIFGDDGYFKSINIGGVPNLEWKFGELVCSSYVPSLVQLQV